VSPRTGRPKIENPKSERLSIRLDDESNKILNDYCEQENIKKPEAVRRGISKLKSDLTK